MNVIHASETASVFFFFKQKTAYEMRISDWSSDVCSSDLRAFGRGQRRDLKVGRRIGGQRDFPGAAVVPLSLEFADLASQRSEHALQARRQAEIGRASRRGRVSKYV